MATKRGSRTKGAPKRSASKDTVEHFARFVSTLTIVDDETGETKPFQLEDFQIAMVADYFAGYLETIVEVPSGNGKTTLFAALALHHGTYVRRDCRALILSSTGKQAQQMYEAAAGFVERSRDLKRWWKPQMYGLGRIKSLTDRGVIEIASPSLKATEGEIPSLVLADELHRVADDGAAYTMVLSKMKKRKARAITATTAGEDEHSFLGRKRRAALANGNIVEGHLRPGSRQPRPGEYYTRAVDPDGITAYHEWSVPDEIAEDDYAEIKKANPLSTITVEVLRSTHVLMKARPWDWARQILNRWVLGQHSAIDPLLWRKQFDVDAGPVANAPFWVGLDMGGVDDSTGIVAVWRIDETDDDGNDTVRFVTARGEVVWPPGNGEWTLVADIVEKLDEIVKLPGVFQGIVFDRNKGGGYVAQDLEKQRDWLVIDHGQGAEMDSASDLLATAVAEGSLTHDGREQVTRQVLSACAKRSRRNRWYLDKPSEDRKIDAAIALAMALRVAHAGVVEDAEEIDPDDYDIEVL